MKKAVLKELNDIITIHHIGLKNNIKNCIDIKYKDIDIYKTEVINSIELTIKLIYKDLEDIFEHIINYYEDELQKVKINKDPNNSNKNDLFKTKTRHLNPQNKNNTNI